MVNIINIEDREEVIENTQSRHRLAPIGRKNTALKRQHIMTPYKGKFVVSRPGGLGIYIISNTQSQGCEDNI